MKTTLKTADSGKLSCFSRVILAAALAASAFIAASCKPAAADAKPADVDYYTCTMHPSVRSQDPHGKCPICSMNLVPVLKKHTASATATNSASAAAQDDAPGDFIVPIRRQEQIGVTYATVETRPFVHTVRVVGTVTHDKQRLWDYTARVDGYVGRLFVSSPGELVAKDQPLLDLYSPELLTTENELADLLRALDDARAKTNQAVIDSTCRLVESARQRLLLWNVGEDQIKELEKTRQPREYLTLVSPVKGVIRDIPIDQGRRVAAGDHLLDVVDLSVVWVWAQFYQDDLPMLRPGLPFAITTSSYPGEVFNGKISVMDPFINNDMRTGRVRIDVENADFKLRPDMYVDASLTMDMGSGLAIPVSAVLPTGTRNIIFIDKGEGHLEPRFVGLGRKYGDDYEVTSGVAEKERVVTSANFLIDAEAGVQGALKAW